MLTKEILPSGEDFLSVVKKLSKLNLLGVVVACVSVEHLEPLIKKISKMKVPFGFKINAFQHIPAGWKPDSNNPNVKLGKKKDLTPATFYSISKKIHEAGATILGGCCEITPKHIASLKKI